MNTNPIKVFKDNTQEWKGEDARLSSFVGAIAIADLVKSTLGPKGMDKIIQSAGPSGELNITNDGATILSSVMVDNPAARVLIDISKIQDKEVGDGTTSVCVLAGELLREAEKLTQQKIHPMTIIEGYRNAQKLALEALEKIAVDHRGDEAAFREDLMNIARTTLNSKILSSDREHFAKLAVDAVLSLGGSSDLSRISVIKKMGGSLKNSEFIEGFVLDKEILLGCSRRVKNAKILIANTKMDADRSKILAAKVKATSHKQIAEIEKAEENKMREKCAKIMETGVNVFVNRELIYDLPARFFGAQKIMAIEGADLDGIERLAYVSGAEITSVFNHPENILLGEADLVEEMIVGEEKVTIFRGLKGKGAATIILRGSSKHILAEAERSLHDALAVLSRVLEESRVIFGAGNSEMIMARIIEEAAIKTPGKLSLAIDSYAKALRQIPTIIADNGGYDAGDIVAKLRAAHALAQPFSCTLGLDMENGDIADISELHVLESYKSKRHSVIAATEAAEQILRVDSIIHQAPRRRE